MQIQTQKLRQTNMKNVEFQFQTAKNKQPG